MRCEGTQAAAGLWGACAALAGLAVACAVQTDDPLGPCLSDTASALGGARAPAPAGSDTNRWAGVGALWDDEGPMCTAVVIAPHWALTARHCRPVFRASAPTLRVSLGPDEHTIAPLSLPIEHPSEDLMLLWLDGWQPELPAGVALPVVSVPLDSNWLGQTATLTAWGADAHSERALHLIDEPIVALRHNTIVVDGAGASGACTGDSGGPLLVSEGQQLVVAGILSGGDATCMGRDIYTRLDAQLDWLQQQLGTPPFCDSPGGARQLHAD